jgi:hypothetical protein
MLDLNFAFAILGLIALVALAINKDDIAHKILEVLAKIAKK